MEQNGQFSNAIIDEMKWMPLPQSQCSHCVELREVKKELADLKETVQAQNIIIMETLAKQTELIQSLTGRKRVINYKISTFPVQTGEDLASLDNAISKENKELYVNTIISLLKDNPQKNLLSVLDEEVIIRFNVDGTHGKQRLKSLVNFYSVLKEAFAAADAEKSDSEDSIRKAFANVKKKYFHSKCVKRNKLNIPQVGN